MRLFSEKIVLVTGSVRNTGLEIAKAFWENGATVYVNGRTSDAVASACEAIAKFDHAGGGKLCEGVCDVSDAQQVRMLFEKIRNEQGRLDILVNNAVSLGVGGPVHEMEDQFFDGVIRTNVYGCFFCTREAAKFMVRQKSGSIINISSFTSEKAIRNRCAYISSKGAIDALTRAMALDLGGHGIRVNTVSPGYIRTDRWEELDDETIRRRRENIPLGFEAGGRDIANAVLFFASSDANNITGARLVVDGGCNIQNFPPSCDC